MPSVIFRFLLIGLGICCILLGINIYKGDVSSIHSYNRDRVINVKDFGKVMGFAVILVGSRICILSISQILDFNFLDIISKGVILLGVIIMLYAQLRYNSGF